jgi:beta-mannosidase
MRSTSFNTGWELASADWIEPDGRGKKLGFSRLEWLPAQVPGHVHLDLVRHGLLADPFQARAEIGCQWVDESRWTFRRRFDFHPDVSLPKRVLRFEGLDTVCRVSLIGL